MLENWFAETRLFTDSLHVKLTHTYPRIVRRNSVLSHSQYDFQMQPRFRLGLKLLAYDVMPSPGGPP